MARKAASLWGIVTLSPASRPARTSWKAVAFVSRGRGQGGVGGLEAHFVQGGLVHDGREGVAEGPADDGVGGAHWLMRARSSQNSG